MSLGRLVSTNFLLKSTARNAVRLRPTAGLFAAHRAHVLKSRTSVIVGLGSTRSLSFWGSSSVPSPSPSSVPPPSPIAPKEGLDDVLQPEVVAEKIPSSELTNVSDISPAIDIPSTLQVPPLNYGDLAALDFSHWTPAGVAQWAMELVQVSTGMSWFWTIVAVTILSRLIILPFNITAMRSAAKLAPYQPRLMELRDELQKTGGLSKDPIAVQRISLQQKKIYEDAGVSILAGFASPVVQLPISVGMFLGIKKLCDFPLEQLKVGGFGWITDLTVMDPIYALPIGMAALVSMQLSIGAKDITDDAAQTRHMFNVMKAAAWISLPFIAGLPAGVLVYIITGSVAMTIQSLILRVPSVRKALDIPRIPDRVRTNPPTFLDTVKAGRDWYKQRIAEAQAQGGAQQRKKF